MTPHNLCSFLGVYVYAGGFMAVGLGLHCLQVVSPLRSEYQSYS